MLTKAYPLGNEDKSVINNQEISAEGGAFKFNFMAIKPEPGFYNLDLRVTPSDKGAITAKSVTRRIKIISSVSITDLQITVSESQDAQDIAEGKKFSPEFGKAVAEPIAVNEAQHLIVNFKVKSPSGKSIQAQQVFLRIANNNNREFFVPAKFTGKQFTVHIVSFSYLFTSF